MKHEIPPPNWKMPDFDLEPLRQADLQISQQSAVDYFNATIERLCERARAKGPGFVLIVGSLEQNPRTFGWEIPYAIVDGGRPFEPIHARPSWTVFGPWPEDAKKGGEAEAPPPLDGC
jgi:hypothetical protein